MKSSKRTRTVKGSLKDSWKKGVTIKTNKLGIVDGALDGKAAFDEMIRTLNNIFLDYSIIDINEQNSKDIEQIRKGLNKEFEWDGPPMSFHALKRSLAFFIK
jgi:hypothetical protein